MLLRMRQQPSGPCQHCWRLALNKIVVERLVRTSHYVAPGHPGVAQEVYKGIYILAGMKALVLASCLLIGLASASCHKADDITPDKPVTPVKPPLTQAELLIGKWALVRQSRTDGQTTNTGTWDDSYYVREFTSAGQYLNYSGTRLNLTYPYSLANGVIIINGINTVIYTITSLTSTALVVTYLGQSTFTFTDTYVRVTR
jgi:hypothetical protein